MDDENDVADTPGADSILDGLVENTGQTGSESRGTDADGDANPNSEGDQSGSELSEAARRIAERSVRDE
ncbi:hypothetical protein [Halorubrum saccharovorum]|uniref:hypothetical protein n=1 Tax=Halorubrum saccharovorum TaxID=2248 RepID=UPI0004D4E0C9